MSVKGYSRIAEARGFAGRKDPEEVQEGKRFSCRLPTDLAHISDILASTVR
jgi:hypothetical protein